MNAPRQQPCLYKGDVWHKRKSPKVHSFRYPIFYLLLDLDDLASGNAKPWCLSFDRFNVFSVCQQDYGDFTSGSLKDHILDVLSKGGIRAPNQIMMLTLPRMLGYAFNPMTSFYCYDQDGGLTAILYEVHNTFGERHTYIHQVEPDTQKSVSHSVEKRFHVSPFFPVDGTYKFHHRRPAEKLSLAIQYSDASGTPLMTACLTGERKALNTAALLSVFVKIPLIPFKVIGAIHYQALKLWIKRIEFFGNLRHRNTGIHLSIKHHP